MEIKIYINLVHRPWQIASFCLRLNYGHDPRLLADFTQDIYEHRFLRFNGESVVAKINWKI